MTIISLNFRFYLLRNLLSKLSASFYFLNVKISNQGIHFSTTTKKYILFFKSITQNIFIT